MKVYHVTQLPPQRLSEASRSLIVQTEVAEQAELGGLRIVSRDHLNHFQPQELSEKLTGYFGGELSTQWYNFVLLFYFARS
jgi:hypothetical protein